jgi:hypothetical protein
MRRISLILILITTLLLTACQPKLEEGVTQVIPASHFFDTTAVPAEAKSGDSEAQAHAVVTATPIPVYPTPLPTYLATSRVVTYSPTGQIPATATPVKTSTKTPTSTATPQNTSAPTAIPPTAVKTNTPTTAPTAAPTSASTATVFLYAVQSGSPVQIQNFVNSSAGCAWQGIAGQVFATDGTPVQNIVVRAGGAWNNLSVNLLGMTGVATNYGEGGYELVLGTKVVATNRTVWVQLYDLAGKALSDRVYIATSTDCTKNLVLLNFKEIAGGYENYVPLVVETTTP